MEKNVGSVDLEELRRAREELNNERGIATDPNMYNNYNPNRAAEESQSTAPQDDSVSTAAEPATEPVVESAETSNPVEYSREPVEVATEPVEPSYSEEPQPAEPEVMAAEPAPEIAQTEEEYTAPAATPSEFDAVAAEPAAAEVNEPSVAVDEDVSAPVEAEPVEDVSESVTATEQPAEAQESEEMDLVDSDFLRTILGDEGYEEVKDTIMNTEENEQPMVEDEEPSEIEAEDSSETADTYESENSTEYESEAEEAETSAASEPSTDDSATTAQPTAAQTTSTPSAAQSGDAEFAVNDEDYKEIISDERTDNGMRVTLPNLNKEDVAQEKNFDVYDNFAKFEVHYTPPEEPAPEEDEEPEEQGDEFNEIQNILYGSEEEVATAIGDMDSGVDEEAARRARYANQNNENPNSPSHAVDMASYAESATSTVATEQSSTAATEQGSTEAEAEQPAEQPEQVASTEPETQVNNPAETDTMSDIISENINDNEANSLQENVEEDNLNSNTVETGTADAAAEQPVEAVAESPAASEEVASVAASEATQTTESATDATIEPETEPENAAETKVPAVAAESDTTTTAVAEPAVTETEVAEPDVTETASIEPVAEESEAPAEAAEAENTEVQGAEPAEDEISAEELPEREIDHENLSMDELPAHDYASEDVISRINENYIGSTSVNLADLSKVYEASETPAEADGKTAATDQANAEQTEAQTADTAAADATTTENAATTAENTAETVETATETTEYSTETAETATETAENSAPDDKEYEYSDSIISFTSGKLDEGAEESSEDISGEDSAQTAQNADEGAESVENSKETSESEATEEGTNSTPTEAKTFNDIEDYSYIDAVVDDVFKNSGKFTMMLGKKESGEFEFATVEKGYNLAIFGDMQSEAFENLIGSLMLSLMLKNSSDEVKFLLCNAEEKSGLGALCNNSFVIGKQEFSDKDSILQNLLSVSNDLEERYKMLAKMRVKSVEEYNKLADELGTSILPYNVVIFSNLQSLVKFENSKEINAVLFNLLKFGRIVGIYVVVCSSKPIASTEINYNLPSRIALKTDDEVLSTSFVGTADAKYLKDKNDIIYSKIDNDVQHLKVAKLSKNELKLILQNIED